MADDMHELPLHSVYRGCELYDLQSAERIERAKAEIDEVIATSAVRRLFDFATDAGRSPESRVLARDKCLASVEERQKKLIDIDRLIARSTGIDRIDYYLARLLEIRAARDTNAPWPAEWEPPPRQYRR